MSHANGQKRWWWMFHLFFVWLQTIRATAWIIDPNIYVALKIYYWFELKQMFWNGVKLIPKIARRACIIASTFCRYSAIITVTPGYWMSSVVTGRVYFHVDFALLMYALIMNTTICLLPQSDKLILLTLLVADALSDFNFLVQFSSRFRTCFTQIF